MAVNVESLSIKHFTIVMNPPDLDTTLACNRNVYENLYFFNSACPIMTDVYNLCDIMITKKYAPAFVRSIYFGV